MVWGSSGEDVHSFGQEKEVREVLEFTKER